MAVDRIEQGGALDYLDDHDEVIERTTTAGVTEGYGAFVASRASSPA